ncbi:MAG TPA: polysaccharide biosynthesis/export family protein [Candidatus Limnocylindria bacterium]|nr:polysaccharide biosynthesis/export family protein [Candidatus Limnocylindria bacterium]
MKRQHSIWSTLALVVILGLAPAPARAQTQYVLGIEDVLTVSVYLHPELERTVTVSSQGNVTFPPLGEIKAAGLTPKALGERLADRLSSYLRQTTAVTVTVTRFMSRSVYVTGAVATPGRYGFETMPSLIEVIGQAGGAVPNADLTRVEVIRREGPGRKSLFADVAAAIRDGQAQLPELKPGDTVVVPMGLAGVAGFGGTIVTSGVGVLGEVTRPGVYPVGGGQSLWQVLALAGGFTRSGDLTSVRVITTDDGRASVVTVNLRAGLNRSGRAPYVVKEGDVVFVGTSGAAQFGRAWAGLQSMLTVAGDVANLILVQDILRNR